jgi:hypothetical protein
MHRTQPPTRKRLPDEPCSADENIPGEIVKAIRFPEWKQSIAMEREIQKTLRQTLKKYNLHTDQELFRKAYAYIRQYYRSNHITYLSLVIMPISPIFLVMIHSP